MKSRMVAVGVILSSLDPDEQLGNLSGFEPSMLAASVTAMAKSEAAAMEHEMQEFVADEQFYNQMENSLGFEPSMLAASAPAIEMSDTAAMEPEGQVFVAEEQVQNLSDSGKSTATVPSMTASEIMLPMVPEKLPLAFENQLGNLSDSGQSMPTATVQAKMIAEITAESAGLRVQVEIQPLQ